MSLGVKGNSKDVEEVLNEAKKRNLTIVLYSEIPDSLEKLLGIITEKPTVKPYDRIQGYLQYHTQKGREHVPQKELIKKLGYTKEQVSVIVRRMEKEGIIKRTKGITEIPSIGKGRAGYEIKLLKNMPEDLYKKVLPYVMGIQ